MQSIHRVVILNDLSHEAAVWDVVFLRQNIPTLHALNLPASRSVSLWGNVMTHHDDVLV